MQVPELGHIGQQGPAHHGPDTPTLGPQWAAERDPVANVIRLAAAGQLLQTGWTRPRDAIVDRLMVWFDRDRDGVSQPEELIALRTLGVASISLWAWAVNQTDRHGNSIAFASTFTYWHNGRLLQAGIIDVVFKTR